MMEKNLSLFLSLSLSRTAGVGYDGLTERVFAADFCASAETPKLCLTQERLR